LEANNVNIKPFYSDFAGSLAGVLTSASRTGAQAQQQHNAQLPHTKTIYIKVHSILF
jgi:hypothetical protein